MKKYTLKTVVEAAQIKKILFKANGNCYFMDGDKEIELGRKYRRELKPTEGGFYTVDSEGKEGYIPEKKFNEITATKPVKKKKDAKVVKTEAPSAS